MIHVFGPAGSDSSSRCWLRVGDSPLLSSYGAFAQSRRLPRKADAPEGLGLPRFASPAEGRHICHMSRSGNAAVLSLILPGVGQIYNGDFLRGIFWLIITPGFWIGTGGLLGWVCHLIAAYTAHRRAEKKLRAEMT